MDKGTMKPIRYVTEQQEPYEELERAEALVRLYTLLNKYQGIGTPCPVNYALNGGTEGYRPHRYEFGCCKRRD